MTPVLGLCLALLSALALNWGWVAQHHAASSLPALSPRRPLQSLRLLFSDRGWLVGFTTGLGGWALYVGALALAPLSLVQAVSAGGIGLIAFFAGRRGATTTRRQSVAVGVSIAGLVLLAVSLGAGKPHDLQATTHGIATWLIASLAAAAVLTCLPRARGAGLGAAAGVLYAAGDVATKGAVTGSAWLLLVPLVLVAHGAAFGTLQLAFQRGSAVTGAGLSTLLTNALPIAAGIALFHERLPGGGLGAVRVVAFALVVVAAALLAGAGEATAESRPRRIASPRAIGALLALLAIAVRLPAVWHNALSQDEVASARILREPSVPGLLHHVVRTETTPPFWYAIAWLVHRAGAPIVDVRLLSVALGGALALAVFELGRSLLGLCPAAAASALVAVGFQPLYHGAELRAYELLALLATLLCLVLVRSFDAPGRMLDVALAATVFAGLLTHYFFAYALATAAAWLWLDPAARQLRRRATIAIAAGAGLAAPWIPAFLVQYRHDRFWWIGGFKLHMVVVTPLRFFVPYAGATYVYALAAIFVGVLGAARLARHSPQGRLVVGLAFGPWLAASVAWAAGENSYTVRNLVGAAPFFALAAGAALATVPRLAARTAIAATAVTAAGVLALTTMQAPYPPYQRLASALVAAGWDRGDPIAVFGNVFSFRAPLEWYLPREPLLDVSSLARGTCASVFVIVGDKSRRVPRRDILRQRRAGDFLVDEVAGRTALRLRHATLLAPLRRPPRCVQLSTNPRFEPLA